VRACVITYNRPLLSRRLKTRTIEPTRRNTRQLLLTDLPCFGRPTDYLDAKQRGCMKTFSELEILMKLMRCKGKGSPYSIIAKFHYTDPTRTRHGPDPTRTKSAHIVGDELNSTTRTRPDPHGLFCGETPLGPCGSPTKSARVRSGPCSGI